MSLATTPASTSGETSYASQVFLKGSIVRDFLVHCCRIEPGSTPVPTNNSSLKGVMT
jgi:hypothetical protein